MKYLFIHYPKCSTCRNAKKWLDANHIEYEERLIKENNPTEVEIAEWLYKSGYPIKRFFNTSGNLYKELQLKDKVLTMSEDEQIKLLATDGMLVKRPILVGGDTVLLGFKEEEWSQLK